MRYTYSREDLHNIIRKIYPNYEEIRDYMVWNLIQDIVVKLWLGQITLAWSEKDLLRNAASDLYQYGFFKFNDYSE